MVTLFYVWEIIIIIKACHGSQSHHDKGGK
jgi:hypothetical protein